MSKTNCLHLQPAQLLWLPRFPHTFLISFEPLLDKWAAVLARNSRARHAGQLGHSLTVEEGTTQVAHGTGVLEVEVGSGGAPAGGERRVVYI